MWLTSDRIELPERIDHRSCELVFYPRGEPEKNPESYAVKMFQVDPNTIGAMPLEQQNLYAAPSMFAILHSAETSVLMVWPQPDKAYYAEFYYHPAMKKL